MNILFTGVGRRVELIQAFRQAALILNTNLRIYGADMDGTAPALAYCDYIRKVCGMRDSGYIGELVDICNTDHIDLLIPTIDTDLLVLSENVDKFPSFTKVMISAPEMIRICRDKNLTSRFFSDCGLKAPMPVNDYQLYDAGFPAFIKPKDGSSSINAYKVENEEQLEAFANKVDDYIVQPFISGCEYTIDVFCDWNGEPIYITPRERLTVRAGEVLKTKITLDERMIEESLILCRAFKPCGPMTVQLIRDEKNGYDYFIEINPRFGGGASLSMKAGARSAEAIIKIFSGDTADYTPTSADGAIYSRFDQSVCIDEGRSPEKIKGVIFDLDDTLYSEKEYIKSGYRKIAEYLGEEKVVDELWRSFEAGQPAIDELVKTRHIENQKTKLLDLYRNQYPDIHLYVGVKDLIAALKSEGIKVGIITDGRPEGQRNKLKALGLDKLIDNNDVIITDELGGIQFRKPCDIAFRIIQKRWKLPCQQIIYIGDNANKDFQACRQLGMKWLWFENCNGLYSAGRMTFSQLNSALRNRVTTLRIT